MSRGRSSSSSEMKAVSWLAQRDFESMFCAHDSALPKKKRESQVRTGQIGKASRGCIKCHQAFGRPKRGADQAVAFVPSR